MFGSHADFAVQVVLYTNVLFVAPVAVLLALGFVTGAFFLTTPCIIAFPQFSSIFPTWFSYFRPFLTVIPGLWGAHNCSPTLWVIFQFCWARKPISHSPPGGGGRGIFIFLYISFTKSKTGLRPLSLYLILCLTPLVLVYLPPHPWVAALGQLYAEELRKTRSQSV